MELGPSLAALDLLAGYDTAEESLEANEADATGYSAFEHQLEDSIAEKESIEVFTTPESLEGQELVLANEEMTSESKSTEDNVATVDAPPENPAPEEPNALEVKEDTFGLSLEETEADQHANPRAENASQN